METRLFHARKKSSMSRAEINGAIFTTAEIISAINMSLEFPKKVSKKPSKGAKNTSSFATVSRLHKKSEKTS